MQALRLGRRISACTHEELEELGMTHVTGSATVGEFYPVPDVGAKPEPYFPDGVAQHEVQSHEEAVGPGLRFGRRGRLRYL